MAATSDLHLTTAEPLDGANGVSTDSSTSGATPVARREFGFNIIGHIHANAGLGVIVRDVIGLILDRGYPVALYDVMPKVQSLEHASLVQYEVDTPEDLPYSITVSVLSLTVVPRFVLAHPQIIAPDTVNVGFFWWELAAVPDVWVEALQQFDVLVAGSQFVRATLDFNVRDTQTVLAVPRPICGDGVAGSRARFEIPEDTFTLMCIVEPTSDPERKNPYAAVEAFVRAFPENERALLIVKLNNARIAELPATEYARLKTCCAKDSRIRLLESNVPYDELLALYASCDVFVGLHRAEGLGLTLLEAMALGKPVIATAWSGNTMFMNHVNSCLVRYRLIPVAGTLAVYTTDFLKKEALWAEPDIDDAAAWMRRLADDPGLRSRIGKQAAADTKSLRQESKKGVFVDEICAIARSRAFLKGRGPANLDNLRAIYVPQGNHSGNESAPMSLTPNELVQRLYRDQPLFHFADERGALRSAELGYKLPPNAEFSMAVTPPVLRWIANHVRSDMTTIETGAGYTTVVFAVLGTHHHCCTASDSEVEKIRAYLTKIGVPLNKVTFHVGPTDQTLPKLPFGQVIDFAYIDGCHGYPYPALDWHYIDSHLKVGGLLGMDNAELRPVREHCEFLEEDGSYRLEHVITDTYFVRMYRKIRDEHREWIYQAYSIAKKDPCDMRIWTRLKRKASRWLKPYLF